MTSEANQRVHRALEQIRQGRMVVLVDDEDRENEGDLCMAADLVTPQTINFMARFGRGLICLALTPERVNELKLPMMVEHNRSPRSTAFTVSVEARTGVTTGISAADRARTIQVTVHEDTHPSDLVSPGHVFPLRATPGGVLQRSGHTEGAVDLARLAGRKPAGVICEVMRDDGTMARYPALREFAQQHQLHLLSIPDLIQYRLQTERLVHRVTETKLALGKNGRIWSAYLYQSEQGQQFLALTLGKLDPSPVLARVHVGSVLTDVFGATPGRRTRASEAVNRIEREGKGVMLFIPPRLDLGAELSRLDRGTQEPESGRRVLREVGLGAQVLADLGLRKLRLLTNRPSRVAAVDGFDLEVVEHVIASEEAGQEHEAGLGVPH